MRDLNKVADAAKKAGRSAGDSAKSFDVFGAQTGITTQALAGGLAAGAAVAGAALVKFGVDSVQAASALQEQISAAEVTFGRASQAIIAFADKSSGALGLSRAEALSAANAVGGFFKAAGAGVEDTAAASESLVRLSADLASFRDIAGGAPEVLERLRSGLAGEAEPLRRLGIFLNEASVKSKAAELGLGAVGRELTDGEKIAARYALIIEQTGDAQGDMARTADSFANQQRRLSAEIDRLKESIGGGLTPAAADAAGFLADLVVGVGQLGEKARSTRQAIADFEVAGIRVGDVVDEFSSTVGDIVGKLPGMGQVAIRVGGALADMGSEARETETDTYDLLESFRIAGQAAEVTEKNITDLRSALLAVDSAQRGYNESLVRVSDAGDRVVEAQEELNELLAKGAVDTREVSQAARSLADAHEALDDATHRVTEAQGDLDALMARGAVNLEDVERATRDLTDAERDLGRAQEGVADAQEKVVEAEQALVELRSGRAAASATAEATEELTEAQFAQRRAASRLSDAEHDLAVLQASRKGTSQELTDAQLDVEEASWALHKADQELLEAQEAVTEAQRLGAAGSDELASAERDLRDANNNLRDANQRVADSTQTINDRQRALRDAQAGDPAFARDLEAARRAVEAANRGVADATQTVYDREEALRRAEAGDPEFANRVASARRNLRDAQNEVADSKYNVSRQAYELARAQEEENRMLGAGVGAARALRGELDALVRAHPEIRAFLAPTLGRLANAAMNVLPGIAADTGNFMRQLPLGGGGDFHQGGFVPAGVTVSGANLHGPEAVIPLSRMGDFGGGGAPVILQVAGSVVTERQLIDVVHEGLLRKQRQTGSLGLRSN